MEPTYSTTWGDTGATAPDLFLKQAGYVLPYPKAISRSVGTVYAPELGPEDIYTVSQQGPTTSFVLLTAFGGCPSPTGESFAVSVPPSASQMFDTTFGLHVPGALLPGESVRTNLSSRNGTRYVSSRPVPKQKNLPYVSSVHGGAAIGTKGYGEFPYTDEHGITHQPTGVKDPVVNRTQINVLYDGKTVKLDASTNSLYADILGLDAPGSASDTIPPGPLHAGRGLVIIPGPGPTDPVTVTMQVGGGIEAGKYEWAWSVVRGGKETGLSPGKTGTAGPATVSGVTSNYGSASLDIPGVLSGDTEATAIKLYRRDTSIGADGTIHTKFNYVSHGAGVPISDPSTGATVEDSGSMTGYYKYIVLTTKGPLEAGFQFEYSPLAYVIPADPPILIDPRDGSATTLDVGSNKASTWVTSDGGTLNNNTGDITFPTSSSKNLTTFELVASLGTGAQTYVDSTSNTALGAKYQRDVQTIHNLPYGGAGIMLVDLELDDYHHYIVHHVRLSTDGSGHNVSGLTTSAPYVGLPGQDLGITESSGTYPNALAIKLHETSGTPDSALYIDQFGTGVGVDGTSVQIVGNVLTAPGGGGGTSAGARVHLDATTAAPPSMGGSDLPRGTSLVAWTDLDFDTTAGSMWSVSHPGRLVATEAGLYQISAGLAVTVYDMDTITIAQGFKMSFQVTSTHGFGWNLGGTKGTAYSSSAGDPIICVGSSVGIQLGVGDYVEVFAGTDYTNVAHPATWETNGDEPCWFSLMKCG